MKTSHSAEAKQPKISRSRWCILGIFLIAPLLFGESSAGQTKVSEKIPELPSFEVRPFISLPVAVKVAKPVLPRSLAGTKITMTFTIGKDGIPRHIRYPVTLNSQTASLAAAMQSYLPYWRFDPAKDQLGNAHPVKVALPVEAVSKRNGNHGRYASINLSTPVLVAVLD